MWGARPQTQEEKSSSSQSKKTKRADRICHEEYSVALAYLKRIKSHNNGLEPRS